MPAPLFSPAQLPASAWRATAIVLGISTLLMTALALHYRSPAPDIVPHRHPAAAVVAPPHQLLVLRGCVAHAGAHAEVPQKTRQRKAARVAT